MPDSNRRLVEFAPGEPFDGAIFAVADMALRYTSQGSPFLQLKVSDCTGERAAKLWNAPEDIVERLNGTQLVKVRGHVESMGRYRGDLKLTTIEVAPPVEDPTPYLPPLPADHGAHLGRFRDIVSSVKNPHLKALLKEIFHPNGEFWARFVDAPAAKSMHHAHRGGLIEHSGEVALLCERIASTLHHLDRDLLITAALLHDIGKLEEMEGGISAGKYTAAGNLVGHVVLGTCTVASAAEKIEGFPPKLKHELMHLILSHHGEPEYGAARRPMCAEALILSLCDLMSAKVAQCRDKAGGNDDFASVNLPWHGIPTTPRNSIYVGLMRELMDQE